MGNQVVGLSLKNYIYKEGYTKSSFSKFINIDYDDLNLIIEDRFVDKNRYDELLIKILHKIKLNKKELIDKYFHKNIIKEQTQIIKKYKNNIFKLNREQREILIDLLENEISSKSKLKKEYECSKQKPWRIEELNSEIENFKNIILVLRNMIVIK